MLNFFKNSSALSSTPRKIAKRKTVTTKQLLRDLRSNDDGIAAVEFAILAPIMIALYFGLVEISLFIHADKSVSHATNIAGDLATQLDVVDAEDIEDVFAAAIASMALKPEKIPLVKGTLTSYHATGSGVQEIGKATLGGGVTDAFDPTSIDERLLNVGTGALVAQLEYQYESVTYKFVEPVTNMKESFVLKPRVSTLLPFSIDGSYGSFACTASGGSVNCG